MIRAEGSWRPADGAGRCSWTNIPDCHVIVRTSTGLDLVPVRRLLPHSYTSPDASPERLVRFSPDYFDAIVDGRKTATTRWDDPCAVGPAWLLFEFDEGYRRRPGYVEPVQSKRFDALTEEDARLEGCAEADELRQGLRDDYPHLEDATSVDVVRFRLAGPITSDDRHPDDTGPGASR